MFGSWLLVKFLQLFSTDLRNNGGRLLLLVRLPCLRQLLLVLLVPIGCGLDIIALYETSPAHHYQTT